MRLIEIPIVILGIVLIVAPMDAAVRTFVVARGVPVAFTRIVFRSIRMVFNQFVKFADDYEGRDRIMALYAPVSLLALPTVFLITIFSGFACLYYVWDDVTWANAFVESGSSLLTLGFARPPHLGMTFLAFAQAAIGLGLVALLVAFLPTIYNSFSRREVAVTGLAVRAGTPPTAWELLERAQRTGFLDRLDDTWELWETWFQELSETHTSFGVLAFFRSPNPHRSWITASGAVLDAASMRYAILDVPWSAPPALCIRSGYLALQEIASFYNITFDPDPGPGDPISITREEFDTALQRLALAGCPVRADRDQAWRDFAGWRVNYDRVLTALAGLVMAPYAPWSSDRSTRYQAPRLRPPGARAARRAGRR